MPLFRRSSDKKLAAAGIDPARLPPGQYLTEKWPVLQAGGVPKRSDLVDWRLRVFGEVRRPFELSLDELRALPATDVRCDIHCVTRWSRFDMPWRGISVRDLLARAEPTDDARHVVAHAFGGYTANLPLAALLDDDVLVAFEADGAPLSLQHGYPARLLVPKRYLWKSAKWLTGLELTARDEPGFWEGYGYHNDAHPFAEERYAF